MRTLPNNRHKIYVRLGQAGMASILVTMVLMIVISLIVLGFAQVSRRNQREALDNQLSNQAFYAAETGVNDYSKVIKTYLAANPDTAPSNLAQDSCAPQAGKIYIGNVPSSGTLSTSPDVAYTCVLVNATPTSLQYSSVDSTSLIIPINSNTPIDNLTLSWQTTRTDFGTTNPAGGCKGAAAAVIDQFPQESSWPSSCGLSILRVDLVPIVNNQSIQDLQANTMTAFLVPTTPSDSGSGLVSYLGTGNNQYQADANQGAVVAANCNLPAPDVGTCRVTINKLGGTSYYLRVNTIYGSAALQVQGYASSSPSAPPLQLTGAQVLIDSTGKAQDVLRRIQVRLPINSTTSGNTFDSAIQSSLPLCKQFWTYPGFAADKSGVANCTLP